MSALYEVYYKDYHVEYIRAKNRKEAEKLAPGWYKKSPFWFAREM